MSIIASKSQNVQKLAISVSLFSLVGLFYICFTTDPLVDNRLLWIFFTTLGVCFSSVFLILIFVYNTTFKKRTLTWKKVINSIYNAITLGGTAVIILILGMVEQFNIISVSILLAGAVLYYFASANE